MNPEDNQEQCENILNKLQQDINNLIKKVENKLQAPELDLRDEETQDASINRTKIRIKEILETINAMLTQELAQGDRISQSSEEDNCSLPRCFVRYCLLPDMGFN